MPRPNRGFRLSDKPNTSGYYEICWTENRRSKRRSTGCSNYEDAQLVFAEFILKKDAAAPAQYRTVNWALDYYVAGHVLGGDVVDTERAETAINHIRVNFGDKVLRPLHPGEADEATERSDIIGALSVEEYIRQRAEGLVGWVDEKGNRRGFKPAGNSTVRRELVHLIAAINFAVSRRKLTLDSVPPIKLPPGGDPKNVWLDAEELKLLLQEAAKRRGKDGRLSRIERFIHAAFFTAGRKSAVESLRWSYEHEGQVRTQIDLENWVIHLNPAGRRQTKKKRASVLISPIARPFFKRAYDERVSDWFLDSSGSIRKALENCGKRAGIAKKVTANVLRHTAATLMAQGGVDMWRIALILGDRLETVEKNYAHHQPKDQEQGVERLGDVISGLTIVN